MDVPDKVGDETVEKGKNNLRHAIRYNLLSISIYTLRKKTKLQMGLLDLMVALGLCFYFFAFTASQ